MASQAVEVAFAERSLPQRPAGRFLAGVLLVIEGRLAGFGNREDAEVLFAVFEAAVADDERILVEEQRGPSGPMS